MELEGQQRLANLPQRPRGSYLNRFRSQNICTNHFHVQISNLEKIYIFSIRYTPDIAFDNKQLRKKLLNQVFPELKNYITNPVISGNNIYSNEAPLKENFEINACDGENSYVVVFKQVKVLDVKENPKVLLSFLNNGLRNIMNKLNYTQIGRSGKYFNIKEKKDIDGLMMFSGYKSNFVLLENGYFLRIDSAKKIVRNQTVLQFIDQLYKIHADKDREERRNILQNELLNKIVMTNYGKTSYHKIQEILFEDIDATCLDGESIPIKEYYQKKYSIQIKSNKQPLLKVQNRKKNDIKRILLVPELCLMTGIPDTMDEFRRKKISENTIRDASCKQDEIKKLMRDLKDTAEFASLKEIGIKINKDMEVIKGKIIPNPRITLGEHNSIEQGKEGFFNLFNKPIFASKHSIKCGIIYFNGVDTRGLIDTFESTSRNLKVKLEVVKLNAGEIDNRKAMSIIDSQIRKAVKEDCNICCIIIPNNLKTQYKKIKTMALIDHKIICQITTEGTLRKKNLQSIATKILLQIIAKRGNTLWVPKTQNSIEDSMICGFEQAKISGNRFNLSLCATINSTFSSIFSKNEVFEGSDKKFMAMVSLALNAVTAYVNRNKNPPSQMFVFHNSVSGDQMFLFQEHFINPLKTQLESAFHEKTPCITLIMVNVKTSERFFTEGQQARNVPAGTLISESIVTKYYDFYMVSQNSNRGASVPNHYKVIYTDSKVEEGRLQELIYSQCFNYVNWTGSIKVPGILQYAEKCSKFAAEILETQEICEDLQNKLYFV